MHGTVPLGCTLPLASTRSWYPSGRLTLNCCNSRDIIAFASICWQHNTMFLEKGNSTIVASVSTVHCQELTVKSSLRIYYSSVTGSNIITYHCKYFSNAGAMANAKWEVDKGTWPI